MLVFNDQNYCKVLLNSDIIQNIFEILQIDSNRF